MTSCARFVPNDLLDYFWKPCWVHMWLVVGLKKKSHTHIHSTSCAIGQRFWREEAPRRPWPSSRAKSEQLELSLPRAPTSAAHGGRWRPEGAAIHKATRQRQTKSTPQLSAEADKVNEIVTDLQQRVMELCSLLPFHVMCHDVLRVQLCAMGFREKKIKGEKDVRSCFHKIKVVSLQDNGPI